MGRGAPTRVNEARRVPPAPPASSRAAEQRADTRAHDSLILTFQNLNTRGSFCAEVYLTLWC